MAKPAKLARKPTATPRVTRRNSHTEDEALNQVCNERLDEPRYPIQKLLKKMGYGLVR